MVKIMSGFLYPSNTDNYHLGVNMKIFFENDLLITIIVSNIQILFSRIEALNPPVLATVNVVSNTTNI